MIVICGQCGSRHLRPQVAENVLRAWYRSESYGFTRGVAYSVGENGFEEALRVASRLADLICKQTAKGSRILDIGCGEGLLLTELCRRGYDAHGIDVNPSALRKCRQRGLTVREMSLNAAPDAFQKMDVVVLADLFEHFGDPSVPIRAVSQMLRRPGGLLVLEVPNAGGFYSRFLGRGWWYGLEHAVYYTKAGLGNLLGLNGFVAQEWHSDNFNLFSTEGAVRLGLLGPDAVWGRVGFQKPLGKRARFAEALGRALEVNSVFAALNHYLDIFANKRLLGDQLRVLARFTPER